MSVPNYLLLKNVHSSLSPPSTGQNYLTKQNFYYHHYKCDGFNDVGWGCAYRTLQSICSMLKLKRKTADDEIPSIKQIQEILVRIGDKDASFVNSREWIGGAETCYVIDELFQVPCYLHHITSGDKISSKKSELINYFKTQGGLVAMGGYQDAGSKLIAGVHVSRDEELLLLVVDPHYVGIPKDSKELFERGYVRWQPESDFMEESFYNLCMPKIQQ